MSDNVEVGYQLTATPPGCRASYTCVVVKKHDDGSFVVRFRDKDAGTHTFQPSHDFKIRSKEPPEDFEEFMTGWEAALAETEEAKRVKREQEAQVEEERQRKQREWNQKVENFAQAVGAGEQVDLSFKVDRDTDSECEYGLFTGQDSLLYHYSAAQLTSSLEEAKPEWWGKKADHEEHNIEEDKEESCKMDLDTFKAKWKQLSSSDAEAYEKFELLLSVGTGPINTITYTRSYQTVSRHFYIEVLKAEICGHLLTIATDRVNRY
eukprot:gene19929-23845_t